MEWLASLARARSSVPHENGKSGLLRLRPQLDAVRIDLHSPFLLTAVAEGSGR